MFRSTLTWRASKGVIVLGALVVAAAQSSAMAQAPSCASLTSSFQDLNKELSAIDMDGLGDDSAPRETNRQLREVNTRLSQSMIIDRMVQAKCTLPDQLSGGAYYMSAALSCKSAETDAMTAARKSGKYEGMFDTPEYKAACDREGWQPTAPKAKVN